MKRFATVRAEFAAIFQKRMRVMALITIMFIPVLYAGTYLYAFKDPYAKLDELPVAVVNLDQGADFEGEKLTIGADFVDKLKDKDSFQWHFISEEEAEQGLKENDYYMVVRIPKDFSENATTLMDEQPKHLELDYIPNKAYNFLAAQIGASAVEKIKEEISATITETYAESMFDSLTEVSNGLQEAGDGAGKLRDGGQDAGEGANELHTHLQELAEKSIVFQNGLSDAKNGSVQLADGLQTLQVKSGQFQVGMTKEADGLQTVSGKLGELASGLGQLEEGQESLYSNALKLQKGAGDLSGGLQTALAGLNELKSKIPAATAGTKELANGAAALAAGSTAWKQGAEQASAGAAAAATGAASVANGLAALEAQVAMLPEPYKTQMQSTLHQLAAGSKAVQQGTEQVAAGTNTLAEKAGELASGAAKLAAGANALQNGQVQVEAGVQALASGQEQLAQGAAALANGQAQYVQGAETFGTKLAQAAAGANQLASGTNELTDGMNQLLSGSVQMGDGVGQLASGATKLTTGVTQLADGSSKLADGSVQLADGSSKLANGLTEITNGAGELSQKLQDAAVETSEAKGSEEKYEMFAKPVELVTESFGEAANYATGVAPYFISLGLYVGAIMLTVIYPLREAAGIPSSGLAWFLSKYAVIVTMSIMQSLIVASVVLFGLDIEVTSVPSFMLFTFITSITFLSIVQFLVTTLGDVGRFIAILLLVMQLVASAGTYPVELVADVFQPFAAYVPMTYSVSGFRSVISAGNLPAMWDNAFILFCWVVVSVLGTMTCFTILYRRYFRKLAQ